MTSVAARLLILPIRGYQRYISAYTPPSCRYYPCCSAYAITALREHGAVKGIGLTVWRLLRCNPWSDGGVDHVPSRHGHEREPSGPVPSSHAVPTIDARPRSAGNPTTGRTAA